MSIRDLANDGVDVAMLTDIEARILGSLMEKQLTTPEAYPLTLNSLVLACNQKTNREPVTSLSQGDVQHSLSQMQERKLIAVDYGARAQRYDQRLTRVLGVDQSVQALLTVILLRGPQTVVELFTRTQRMNNFSSPAAVEEKLEELRAKSAPLITRLPRLPGQREERYMHLLCGAPDVNAVAPQREIVKEKDSGATADLAVRVALLEQQLVALQQKVESLLIRSEI